MITAISEQIAALPAELRQICDRIFSIDVVTGSADPPASMEPWVIEHFGAVDAVRSQTIVKVTNRLTLEGAIFNPLRARRPSDTPHDDGALRRQIDSELAAGDIFSDPLRMTTADQFGRIRGRFCVTASNVAKYEGWHGLVIFDEPDPLCFRRAQIADYLDVALRWLKTAHASDPKAIYPLITWNCLPKSGATQMHGHMQVALGRSMHYARIESWRRAAASYAAMTGASYFNHLFAIHEALGLVLTRSAGPRGFVHLTPLRDAEVVLFGEEGLADAIYEVLRVLMARQGLRPFNLIVALPPLGATPEDWQGFPVLTRVVGRGAALTTRSDWGAMELFAMGCVVTDPFEVAKQFRPADDGPG